ncbi:MAG: hypothetical protein SW833_27270 [Cyanobacteriota bacterium]|nr:hypothetical protein [Cyanobacteriota bacterium]
MRKQKTIYLSSRAIDRRNLFFYGVNSAVIFVLLLLPQLDLAAATQNTALIAASTLATRSLSDFALGIAVAVARSE